jgi:hypothetical protein
MTATAITLARRDHEAPVRPPESDAFLLAVLAATPPGDELVARGEPLSAELVLSWVRRLAPYHDWWGAMPEMAAGMADAANALPLSPGAEHETAAYLIALAAQASGLQPNLVRGSRFGLYQIEVPSPELDATALLVPRSASFAACEMLAQALSHTPEGDVAETLLWYDDSPLGWAKSRARLELAAHLVATPA